MLVLILYKYLMTELILGDLLLLHVEAFVCDFVPAQRKIMRLCRY